MEGLSGVYVFLLPLHVGMPSVLGARLSVFFLQVCYSRSKLKACFCLQVIGNFTQTALAGWDLLIALNLGETANWKGGCYSI